MGWIITIVVAIVIVAIYRNVSGSSAVSLYRKDPQAGLLHIARHWLEGQPKVDNAKLSDSWPSIEVILKRPEVLQRYVQLVESRGAVTGSALIQAFSQFFMRGNLPDDMSREIQKCWKGRLPSPESVSPPTVAAKHAVPAQPEPSGTKCPRCYHEWTEPDWRCPEVSTL